MILQFFWKLSQQLRLQHSCCCYPLSWRCLRFSGSLRTRQGRFRRCSYLCYKSSLATHDGYLWQVERWIAFSEDNLSKAADFKKVSDAADELDRYLTLRTFLVAYQPTAADFAVWGALKSS